MDYKQRFKTFKIPFISSYARIMQSVLEPTFSFYSSHIFITLCPTSRPPSIIFCKYRWKSLLGVSSVAVISVFFSRVFVKDFEYVSILICVRAQVGFDESSGNFGFHNPPPLFSTKILTQSPWLHNFQDLYVTTTPPSRQDHCFRLRPRVVRMILFCASQYDSYYCEHTTVWVILYDPFGIKSVFLQINPTS